MNKFLIALLLLPATVIAQTVNVDKSVACNHTEVIMDVLTNNSGEAIVWGGKATKSTVVVMVNPTTGSWSIVQLNDKVACILEVGEGFKFKPDVFQDKNKKAIKF